MSDNRPGPLEASDSSDRPRLPPPEVVADTAGLDKFLAAAQQASSIGVDTESNSLYVYFPRICLIQASLPDTDYIIDPLAVDVAALGDLFANPRIQKVFHAAENDILGLKRDYDFSFANIFDTMIAARILGWPHAGLAAILDQRFGVQLDKRLQRTDWGQRPLEANQLAYARLDTHYLLPLRAQQTQELQARRRWVEAQESFARLPDLEWMEKPFDTEGFWRLKGTNTLSTRELSVLRELYLYREERARQLNRPPFKVIDQQTLIRLSRQQPASLQDLRRTPGLSKYQVRRHGKGILQTIARGRTAPAPKPRRRPRQPGTGIDAATKARYDALRRWRGERAQRRGVEPDIVLTNDQLMAVARLEPANFQALEASNILSPWKLQEYGEEIMGLLAKL